MVVAVRKEIGQNKLILQKLAVWQSADGSVNHGGPIIYLELGNGTYISHPKSKVCR